MATYAERAAFEAVPETCPGVDDEFEKIDDALSAYRKAERQAREKLRQGLIEAYGEVERLQTELDSANAKLEETDEELDEARDRIKELEADLAQQSNQAEIQPAMTPDGAPAGGTDGSH